MRIAFSILVCVVWVAPLHAADDSPTPEEQKVIDAVGKLGGKASVDLELSKDARLLVKFKELNDTILAALKKHPEIGAIETFDTTRCSDKAFDALDQLPHLWRLKLGKSAATDKTLAALADCKELRLLYVTEARITDNGVANLKKLTRLESLDLSANRALTDGAITHIKTLERLEHLYLANTQVTDKGLFELAGLEGLRTLNLANTKVTADAAMKFVDMMPNLRSIRR